MHIQARDGGSNVGEGNAMSNPRYANGSLRRKNRARLRAMGEPCHICGRPIDYTAPSDSNHPLSFVVDEIIPVSRWREFGYSSPRAVAEDFNNLAPAHYACNLMKSNKTMTELGNRGKQKKKIIQDGAW